MLAISNVNEITNLKLDFEEKTIGILYITPDWVKSLFTSPADKLNVTVIEFSLTALAILSRMRYERLVPADPVEGEEVSIYKYSKESQSIEKGRVKKVIRDSIEYTNLSQETKERSLDTEEYCCGVPLLNKQLKVVGIHTNKFEGGTLKVVAIGSILEAFKMFITEKLCGRTENELWLEKIAQIPKNEFDLIGSGGFGKVYKIRLPITQRMKEIKSQTESDKEIELLLKLAKHEKHEKETFVALKVVSGLGNLDEYKNQVDALQKEYRLV